MAKQAQESAAAVLDRFRIRAGLNASQLAKGAGYAFASGLQRYLDPEAYTEPRFPLRLVARFASALVGKGEPPITRDELYLELAGVLPQSDEDSPTPNAVFAPEKATLSPRMLDQDIPVLGVGAAGTSGDFRFNGETIDFVRRPPGISKRKGIFAIYAQGESMAPWRQPGDLVYVDPSRPPKPGDYVLVECQPTRQGEPGDAYLKKLVALTPTKLILEQHNPKNDHLEVMRSRVLHLYRVIDWPELLGV